MLLTADGRKPKHSDFLHLPHGLEGFFDLPEAEAYAAIVRLADQLAADKAAGQEVKA